MRVGVYGTSIKIQIVKHCIHAAQQNLSRKRTLWSCHFQPPSPKSRQWPRGCLGSPCAVKTDLLFTCTIFGLSHIIQQSIDKIEINKHALPSSGILSWGWGIWHTRQRCGHIDRANFPGKMKIWRQVARLFVCLVTQDFSKVEHITTLIPHTVTHLSEKFNLSADSVQRLHIKVGNHRTNQLLMKFFKHNCKTDL